MIWYDNYRMKLARKGIQSGQLELYVRMSFLWVLLVLPFLPLPSLPLPREKREKEKQKRKNQRKE
ncbi:MAG: hypothetical protein UH211_04650 [Agathobacter sp.]|nr:hypothetical protein [Agathobacter sp.]